MHLVIGVAGSIHSCPSPTRHGRPRCPMTTVASCGTTCRARRTCSPAASPATRRTGIAGRRRGGAREDAINTRFRKTFRTTSSPGDWRARPSRSARTNRDRCPRTPDRAPGIGCSIGEIERRPGERADEGSGPDVPGVEIEEARRGHGRVKGLRFGVAEAPRVRPADGHALVVPYEVLRLTLSRDRDVERPPYAGRGVAERRIADVGDRRVTSFRDPVGDAHARAGSRGCPCRHDRRARRRADRSVRTVRGLTPKGSAT